MIFNNMEIRSFLAGVFEAGTPSGSQVLESHTKAGQWTSHGSFMTRVG